jgi:protein tyrosine phosphatase
MYSCRIFFAFVVSVASKDSVEKIWRELQLVRSVSLTTHVGEANRALNRYSDVLPFDKTRVVLRKEVSSGDGDYINASWVTWRAGLRVIAAQGPLPTTEQDFWRMVWQNRVSTIVTLGRSSSTQFVAFWDTVDGAPFAVRAESVSEQRDAWFERQLVLSSAGVGEERMITHLHFYDIPDHSVPRDSRLFAAFVARAVERAEADRDAPLVVHCSAGVGRTGMFLLSAMFDDVASLRDAANKLAAMRTERMMLVQTQQQFAFAWKTIQKLKEFR